MKRLLSAAIIFTLFAVQVQAKTPEELARKRHKNMMKEIAELRLENTGLVKQSQKLERKINRLTQAVEKLSESLHSKHSGNHAMPKNIFCSLTTSEGTFLGKGHTVIEASARALQHCDKKAGVSASFACKKRKVTCDPQ